jgi:hypothetical protein
MGRNISLKELVSVFYHASRREGARSHFYLSRGRIILVGEGRDMSTMSILMDEIEGR